MDNNNTSWCCRPEAHENWYSILKITIILFNFLFMLIGLGLIGLGIYSEVMRSDITEIDHVLVTPSVFLFIIGFIILLFSFVGCVAALRDNLCFLKTFIASIFICVILEIAASISAFVLKDPAKNFVNDYILKGLVTYYDDQDLKNFVDFVQEEFLCCGGRTYTDWEVNPYHNCSAPGPSACGVPYSCCVHEPIDDYVVNSMCGYDTLSLEPFEAVLTIHLTGCIDAVIDFVWGNQAVFVALALGIFLPQLIGIVLGILYLSSVKGIIASQPRPPLQPLM